MDYKQIPIIPDPCSHDSREQEPEYWNKSSKRCCPPPCPCTPVCTIQIAPTITGEPGTQADVKNIGTPSHPILQFYIPRGAIGPVGPVGATGPTGPTGTSGSIGATAPSIYAQHGNCRNHAAFHYLKDN